MRGTAPHPTAILNLDAPAVLGRPRGQCSATIPRRAIAQHKAEAKTKEREAAGGEGKRRRVRKDKVKLVLARQSRAS